MYFFLIPVVPPFEMQHTLLLDQHEASAPAQFLSGSSAGDLRSKAPPDLYPDLWTLDGHRLPLTYRSPGCPRSWSWDVGLAPCTTAMLSWAMAHKIKSLRHLPSASQGTAVGCGNSHNYQLVSKWVNY